MYKKVRDIDILIFQLERDVYLNNLHSVKLYLDLFEITEASLAQFKQNFIQILQNKAKNQIYKEYFVSLQTHFYYLKYGGEKKKSLKIMPLLLEYFIREFK